MPQRTTLTVHLWTSMHGPPGRPQSLMAPGEAICVSPASSPFSIPQECEVAACSGALGGTELATEAVDGRDLRVAGGLPMASSTSTEHVVPGAGQHLAPRTPDHEASCVALEWQRLCALRRWWTPYRLHGSLLLSSSTAVSGRCLGTGAALSGGILLLATS